MNKMNHSLIGIISIFLLLSSCEFKNNNQKFSFSEASIKLESFVNRDLNSYSDGTYDSNDYLQFRIPDYITVVKGSQNLKVDLNFDNTSCNYVHIAPPEDSIEIEPQAGESLSLSGCSGFENSLVANRSLTVSKTITLVIDQHSVDSSSARVKAEIGIKSSVSNY